MAIKKGIMANVSSSLSIRNEQMKENVLQSDEPQIFHNKCEVSGIHAAQQDILRVLHLFIVYSFLNAFVL